MLSIQEIERICQSKFNCYVQDKGFGAHSGGKREIHIIVGKKQNPAYDPNNVNMEIRKNKPTIPDVRIKFIDPSATEKDIIEAIKNINQSLPEDKELDVPVGIATEPMQSEPQIVNTVNKVVSEENYNSVEKEQDVKKGRDEMILGALEDISSAISSLTERVSTLETKKKGGRPKKEITA